MLVCYCRVAWVRAIFSFIRSAAYCVSSLNWFSVSMFLALASISSTISLNTMSLLPIFASSIRSLHAMYRVSFMSVRFLLFYGFLVMMFMWLIVCDIGIMIWNIENAMEFSMYFYV